MNSEDGGEIHVPDSLGGNSWHLYSVPVFSFLKKGSEPLLVNDSLQCCAVAPEKQTEGTQRFVSGSVYFPLKNEIFL